jgi:hypothetical protein
MKPLLAMPVERPTAALGHAVGFNFVSVLKHTNSNTALTRAGVKAPCRWSETQGCLKLS